MLKVVLRSYYSGKHPHFAVHFIRLAKELEDEHDLESAIKEGVTNSHQAYICAALFCSLAFVDAAINEIYKDASHGEDRYLTGLS